MTAEKLKAFYDQMSKAEQDKFYFEIENVDSGEGGYFLFVLAFALIGLLSTGAGIVYLVSKLF